MVWTSGSQGTLAPSLVALFRQADAGWPSRSKLADGSLGDMAHASRTSDHNPKEPNPPGWVDAGDLTRDDTRGPNIDRFWSYLISKRDHRVKYMIHRGRIVKSYVDSSGTPAWVPQTYTGPSPHTGHIHISVTADGRFDTGPWFPPAYPAPPAPTVEESPMFVMRRVEDGTIAFGAPGVWRLLDAEQSGVAHAICKVTDAIPANARQFDIARDLCLTSTINPDDLAARVAALVDGLEPADVVAAVKQALREGSGS